MTGISKQSLRASYQMARNGWPPSETRRAESAIAQHLAGEPAFQQANSIGAYIAMRGELNLLAWLESVNKQLALPVTDPRDSTMHFRAWQRGEALVKGGHGLMEPAKPAKEILPELLLIPLLAFDATGHRIGYGGGYYDRTLRRLRERGVAFHAIGVAHSTQQTPQAIVADFFDERLDAVATESGVVWF